MGSNYYRGKNGYMVRKPHLVPVEEHTFYEEEGDGVMDLPFAGKVFIILFFVFLFIGSLILIPVTTPNSTVIIKEKTVTAVDSISKFDPNGEEDIMRRMAEEKRQQISAVNAEIQKINEKKECESALKQLKKELLTMTAIVDDGFISREILAEAEVDSITADAIDMLTKSIQAAVDSILVMRKFNDYISRLNDSSEVRIFQTPISKNSENFNPLTRMPAIAYIRP